MPLSFGPPAGFPSSLVSAAKPLHCVTAAGCVNRVWRVAIDGLALIVRERLAPRRFTRGGMFGDIVLLWLGGLQARICVAVMKFGW